MPDPSLSCCAPSFYLWLRTITLQKLIDACRFHLGAAKRSIRREVHLFRDTTSQISRESLAAQLLGRLTSVSQAARRAEIKHEVQAALDSMDALDREVLALRHFEQLTNSEVAEVLEISPNAASNRYVLAQTADAQHPQAESGHGLTCPSRKKTEATVRA